MLKMTIVKSFIVCFHATQIKSDNFSCHPGLDPGSNTVVNLAENGKFVKFQPAP